MTTLNERDLALLRRAVELSGRAIVSGNGGPFGAVVARDGNIIGEGRNRVTISNDPTAHAEIEAIRSACKSIESFDLSGCVVYSSCEPCPMCLGAIYWSRADRLVYANTRTQAAAIDFDDAAIYEQFAKPLDLQTLESVHCPLEAAEQVFDQWRTSTTKIKY